MDENKNLENEVIEEAEEVAEETVEETVEEIAAEEVAEEAVEETVEEATEDETFPESFEETAEASSEIPEEIKKGSKKGAVIAVIVALIVIAAAVITSVMETNKYNKLGYVDISGKTVQDIADAQGVTLAEFLATYNLPSDMPGDTTEAAAYYTIPAGVIAEMNGLDFATLKAMLKLPETATEDTPWGEAEGGILLADYIGGEDKVDAFKLQYGLGDDVTGQTPWGEIRNQVDTVTKQQNEAQAAAEAEAEGEPEVTPDEEEVPAE